MSINNLFTTDELARKLGVAVRSIERWRQSGEGPAFVKVGRSVRYNSSDVDDWIKLQTRKSTVTERSSRPESGK